MPSSCKSTTPTKHYANGGRIKGPGTGTSDNVPAKVIQTGEPLAVSNGERIVSVAQDKLLTKVAKGAGHKSLDAMLEAGTGKPVGPTLKYIEQPGSKIKQSAKKPVQHADLGGLVGSLKRAVGLAPPQTMREKFAEQDAKRAPAAAPAAPASAPAAPAGVQGGLDGSGGTSLDKRMAAAGAANGAKIGPVMHAGLGGMIDSVKRAIGVLPPQTMREKYAEKDAKRAPAATPASPAPAPTPAATPAPMGSQGVLDKRMADAGAARGAKVRPGMKAKAKKNEEEEAGDGILAAAKSQDIEDDEADHVQSFSNGGMFSGGDPYAIPGYTPGMVQRSGMGLPGYNPLTQGQTMNMPTNGGNANSDEMEKTEAKGFSGGGAIGKYATSPYRQTNGSDNTTGDATRMGLAHGGKIVRAAAGGMKPDVLEAQKQVMATLDPSWVPPAPAAASAPVVQAPSAQATMPYGEQMRNLGGALQTAGGAVLKAPMEAIKYAVSAPGYEGTPLADLPGIAKNILAQSSSPASPIKQAAQESVKPEFQPSKSVYGDARPATAPEAPGTAPRLNNADGVNVGHGITRFDTPGKSPLFTNMTDAAGMASNQALQNRGAITPQNMAAADALAGKYQREAQNTNQRAANAEQMATETASAQRSNEAGSVLADKVGRRMQNERDIQNGEATLSQRFVNPQQRAAADKQIAAARASGLQEQVNEGASIREAARDTTARRAQDIGDKHFNEQNAIARSRLKLDQSTEGRNAATFAEQQAARDERKALLAAYNKASPADRPGIAEQLRQLDRADKPAHYKTTALQAIKNADGSTSPGMVVTTNEQTGETKVVNPSADGSRATPKAEYDQLPSGATYTGTDGKQYRKG